jgi:hypothetical protein
VEILLQLIQLRKRKGTPTKGEPFTTDVHLFVYLYICVAVGCQPLIVIAAEKNIQHLSEILFVMDVFEGIKIINLGFP